MLDMMRRDQLQTMAKAFSQISQGEDPWVALGNFMNYWFDYAKEKRQQLITDPLPGEEPLLEYHRWAAFCAASVEWFCHTYGEPCPAWVHQPKYLLTEPWYHTLNPHLEHIRARLISTTPEEFAKRNIYCGNRVYANKWEAAKTFKAFHQRQKESESAKRCL